jgi:hypothetical protein
MNPIFIFTFFPPVLVGTCLFLIYKLRHVYRGAINRTSSLSVITVWTLVGLSLWITGLLLPFYGMFFNLGAVIVLGLEIATLLRIGRDMG